MPLICSKAMWGKNPMTLIFPGLQNYTCSWFGQFPCWTELSVVTTKPLYFKHKRYLLKDIKYAEWLTLG